MDGSQIVAQVGRLGAMDDRIKPVAELLHEAGEAHHLVYRIVDGVDPDWASWYADWLRDLSELPQILGVAPVRSELVWLLFTLDKEYTKAGPSTHGRSGMPSGLEHFCNAAGPEGGVGSRLKSKEQRTMAAELAELSNWRQAGLGRDRLRTVSERSRG